MSELVSSSFVPQPEDIKPTTTEQESFWVSEEESTKASTAVCGTTQLIDNGVETTVLILPSPIITNEPYSVPTLSWDTQSEDIDLKSFGPTWFTTANPTHESSDMQNRPVSPEWDIDVEDNLEVFNQNGDEEILLDGEVKETNYGIGEAQLKQEKIEEASSSDEEDQAYTPPNETKSPESNDPDEDIDVVGLTEADLSYLSGEFFVVRPDPSANDLFWICYILENLPKAYSNYYDVKIAWLKWAKSERQYEMYEYEHEDIIRKGTLVCTTKLHKAIDGCYLLSKTEQERIQEVLKAEKEEEQTKTQKRKKRKHSSAKDNKDNKGNKGTKDKKDYKDNKDNKDKKDNKDNKDFKDNNSNDDNNNNNKEIKTEVSIKKTKTPKKKRTKTIGKKQPGAKAKNKESDNPDYFPIVYDVGEAVVARPDPSSGDPFWLCVLRQAVPTVCSAFLPIDIIWLKKLTDEEDEGEEEVYAEEMFDSTPKGTFIGGVTLEERDTGDLKLRILSQEEKARVIAMIAKDQPSRTTTTTQTTTPKRSERTRRSKTEEQPIEKRGTKRKADREETTKEQTQPQQSQPEKPATTNTPKRRGRPPKKLKTIIKEEQPAIETKSITEQVDEEEQEEGDSDIFMVEKILACRESEREHGTKEYLIKWYKWPNKHNTWEPEAHILDKSLIAQFENEAMKDPLRQFYWYIYERQISWQRREAKCPRDKWTTDPALLNNRFCNVYRELDTGTIFFQRYIKSTGLLTTNKPEAIFITIVYRLVNRVSTFEALGSIPTSDKIEPFLKKLNKMKKKGQSVFCGGHQNIGLKRLEATLKYCAKKLDKLSRKILNCSGMKESTDILMGIDNIGKFFAWQITCDFVESGLIPYDNEWVLLGPGARNGLKLIFSGVKTEEDMIEKAKWLQKKQKQEFKKMFLQFPFWHNKEISLKNIEHALCEYSRYRPLQLSYHKQNKSRRKPKKNNNNNSNNVEEKEDGYVLTRKIKTEQM